MITRIVKLNIKPESVEPFKLLFYESQKHISSFEGCIKVDLMRDLNNDFVFFTLSCWKSEEDLEAYRQSYVFKNIWSEVKLLFSEKAEAWSLIPDENR